MSRGARVGPADLPVPARERQVEARIAERPELPLVRVARRDEIGGEVVGVDEEPLVEGALGVVAVEGREDQPGDEQDQRSSRTAPRPRGGPAIERPARTPRGSAWATPSAGATR